MHRYALGQKSMEPLLEAACAYDIATNPGPSALFEAGPGGMQIWCTPEDNPGGAWRQVHMVPGAFSKPCAFVGGVRWQCSQEQTPTVVNLVLSTVAYALCDEELVELADIHNRPEDVAWARQKLFWLWNVSGAPGELPPILVRT